MIPLLFAANALIWGTIWKIKQEDRKYAQKLMPPVYPKIQKPIKMRTCPAGLCEVPDHEWNRFMGCRGCREETEDRLIMQDLDAWMANQRDNEDLEELLWKEGILNPQEIVWANGTPLEPGNEDDYRQFLEIRQRAMLEGVYNSKLWEDGGSEACDLDYFKMNGASHYGAVKLQEMGVKPWEFKPSF